MDESLVKKSRGWLGGLQAEAWLVVGLVGCTAENLESDVGLPSEDPRSHVLSRCAAISLGQVTWQSLTSLGSQQHHARKV